MGCDAAFQRQLEVASSKASGRVTILRGQHDSRIVSGEPDYGFTVTFRVTNHGEPGLIRIMPWLSCSEGEWARSQNLTFASSESRDLTYFFHEPTINAENLEYGVKLSP